MLNTLDGTTYDQHDCCIQTTWKNHMLNSCKRFICCNKKHLKNVGPIHYCEPPHAHSPGVASGTVVRRLCIDVHDANDNDDNNANDNA